VHRSSISQQSQPRSPRRRSAATSPEWRRALGDELRRLRTGRKLTQAAFGTPLTRAFVSAVERGRAVPSIPALEVMLGRVGTPMSEFFAAIEARLVDRDLTAEYDPQRGNHRYPSAASRRR
jgi:transcriptional regulator with XRE-family HTH domain